MRERLFSERVKDLGLPLDQLIVIGSGLLDQLGIRAASDIDLVVSNELFNALKNDARWIVEYITNDETRYTSRDGSVEVWRGGWDKKGESMSYDELLADSVVYDDVQFVSLNFLKDWKMWHKRDKDVADIQLIDQYLKGKEV